MELPAYDRRLRKVGFGLYLLGQLCGGLLGVVFMLPVLTDAGVCGAMCLGMVLAFPAGLVYLTFPRLLDRYDPEPWYALIGCLLWGAIAAVGFSLAINTTAGLAASFSAGPETADVIAAVVSAPLVEEAFKGLGVAGVFFFLRREFDGIVDGIIYATFIALGFATVENVLYYGRAASEGVLGLTFVMRGVLLPWGHPVYTSMIGIGFGMARETEKPWVRVVAPVAGYIAAVALHGMWNGSASLAGIIGERGAMIFICMLPVWLLFVLTFVIIIVLLVRRRGRLIRSFLLDEIALGNLSRSEVDLVCEPFGLLKARRRFGRVGTDFVRATARLALSKWHSQRAHRQQMRTVSMDFVVPLRNRIRELRHELHRQQALAPRQEHR